MAALSSPFDLMTELVRTERSALVRVARAEGLGAEDAVDCVQDALCQFLALAQRGEVPSTAGELPAFAAQIVRNRARNERRRHRNARPHEVVAEIADRRIPEDLVARAEEHVRLRACVDRLCDTQRAVVTLRLLEEKRGEDVAAELQLSRGYVDVLLHRARASLTACMTE